MKRCVFAGLVVLGASVLSLAAVSGQQAARPDLADPAASGGSLSIQPPESSVPFQPAGGGAIRQHPGRQSGHRRRRDARTGAVLRHAALGQRHSLLRVLPRAVARVRRSNRFSKGFKGGQTDRHAMNLVNLRFHPRARFFWDERSGNLEAMVLLPVENRLEMGQDLTKLPDILGAEPRYADLFRQAFGDPEITNERIARALAQFLRSMISYQSRYNDGRLQARSSRDDFPNFTLEENRGKALFLRNCALCHLPDQDAHFVMTEPVNTGLDEDTRAPTAASATSRSSRRTSGASSRRRCATSRSPAVHARRTIRDARGGARSLQQRRQESSEQGHARAAAAFHRLGTGGAGRVSEDADGPTFLSDPRFSDPFK